MREMRLEIPTPAPQDLEAARKIFEESEPRDLFYRAATELVGLALDVTNFARTLTCCQL